MASVRVNPLTIYYNCKNYTKEANIYTFIYSEKPIRRPKV